MNVIAIYTRISRDSAGDRAGVDRQEKACREAIGTTGTEIRLYSDNDISAADPRKRRPQFERLLDDMQAGEVGTVWCWAQDRLLRQSKDAERVIDAADAGNVEIRSINNTINLVTPADRMSFRMGVMFSTMEVENTRYRRAAKGREIATKGGHNGGGQRLFGYTADRSEIIPTEAELVREAASAIIGGASLASIATAWNANGVTTTAGNPWRTTSIRRYMKSPSIAGLREYHGAIVGEASWAGIITPEEHRLLQVAIQRPAQRGRRRIYPLSGIVTCGICGTRMTGAIRDGYRAYRCSHGHGRAACGRVSIKAEPVETLVTMIVLDAVASDEYGEALAALAEGDGETGRIIAQLAEKERWLEQSAADFWSAPRSSPERAGYEKAQEQIRGEIATLTRRLEREQSRSTLASLPTNADAFTEAMDRADAGRQGEIIGSLIERITIQPVKVWGDTRFDPERVGVTWRVLEDVVHEQRDAA